MIGRAVTVLLVVAAIAPVLSGSRVSAETATPIVTNGPASNRVDIAIVGDGYALADLPQYALDVSRLVGGLFAQQPLKAYQRYFNVTKVDVVSAQSGVDHPERGVYRDTAFDATYNCSGIQRLICANLTKVQEVLARSLPAERYDIPIVIVNDPEYGGSGGALTVVSSHADVVELALHELGHSFGHLADEYGGTTSSSCGSSEPWQPNATSATARDNIEWKHWIDDATQVPTSGTTRGVPGLFEGAVYCDARLYRPTYDSKMRSLGRGFDPVNTEQLIKRTYSYVSPIDAVSPSTSTLPFVPGGVVTLSVTPMQPASHALDVRWTVDGQTAGTGVSHLLDLSSLAAGPHEIVAEVRDATPMVRSDPQALLVEYAMWTVTVDGAAQPASFVATNDALTNAAAPRRNYGSAAVLRVRAGGRKAMRAYLMFDVRGLDGPPANAKLRLVATESSVSAGELRVFASNKWRESTITHRRKPAVPKTIAATVGAVKAGDVVEFDLGTAITGNGLYTVVLVSRSTDRITYWSSEGAVPPRLQITTG